jgi:CDP-diacylglycerol--glycerol-3-phosphate 3-phosphatidyltransferase/cardiolipin synthase
MMAEGMPRPEARQDRAARVWTLANLLSASRIPLAFLFVVLEEPRVRLAVLAAAALSDLLDGWTARRFGSSSLGAKVDPVADKIFSVSAFSVLALSGALTPLEVLGVLLRDLLTPVGFLASAVARRPFTTPARAGGKAVTVGQALTLAAWLLESPLLRPLAWATAAMALYALADYGRLAVQHAQQSRE